MSEQKDDKKQKLVNYLFFASIIVAFLFSFYHYYYTKNFDYIVESPCDPEVETCGFRDCENDPDVCLPNELTYYKMYVVKAYDFPKCENNSCETECESGEIKCIPIQ